MEPSRLLAEFPAPSYRGVQQNTLGKIREAFESDNDVVLVRAPTGSGKSLLARAVAGCADRTGEVAGAYYTTPQVSQLEDVAADPLLEDMAVIRGKHNYDCILPGETDTAVDRAPCVREREFDCQVKHRCPYFSDRAIAANREIAAMTLAYFMQTAGSELFGPRDVVVIDEAHGLGEWAEMYATVELGPRTVPFWEDCRPGECETLEEVDAYAGRLERVCERALEELRGQVELSPEAVARRDRIQELRRDLRWFIRDRDTDSATTWLFDQPEGEGGPITVRPMNPERYLRHTVWDRGRQFALFSATILDREAFCRGVGLDPERVALVEVPHTFPLENRPLCDVTQGPMTYDDREQTIPKLAQMLVRLMAAHPDEKGLVHCHSYAIQETLLEHIEALGVGRRVRDHDRENRDAQLETWTRADDPEVFLSVKMEEALDLEGEACRWQLLCKAPYPNTRDGRVAARLEDGQWGWYYRSALRTVIQACGRVVRSPEDYGRTYLGDSSLLELFERARTDMPDWFANQVDAMDQPELPPVDAETALAGCGAEHGTGSHESSRSGRTGASSGTGGDHPLSDVWGE